MSLIEQLINLYRITNIEINYSDLSITLSSVYLLPLVNQKLAGETVRDGWVKTFDLNPGRLGLTIIEGFKFYGPVTVYIEMMVLGRATGDILSITGNQLGSFGGCYIFNKDFIESHS